MIDIKALILVIIVTIIAPIVSWILAIYKLSKLDKIPLEKSSRSSFFVLCLIIISIAFTVVSIYYWYGVAHTRIDWK